jgi:diketogulonate reductase-like aldo/keto reductase
VRLIVASSRYFQAWAPLVRGLRFSHPAVAALSDKYGKAPAQVLLRYSVQKGYVAIPKSASRPRLVANAAIFNFALTTEEVAHLDTLDEGMCAGVAPTLIILTRAQV